MNWQLDSETGEPRDRPFNPFRCPRTPKVQALVDDVIGQIMKYEQIFGLRQRKRKARDQERFETMVTAIVCDLVHRDLTEPDGWVAITLSKTRLGRKNRYLPPVFGTRLPKVLEIMSTPELSFIAFQKGYVGYFGPSRQTTIIANSRLIARHQELEIDLDDLGRSEHEEVIILKRAKEGRWDKGEPIDYKDTQLTNAYRDEMKAINAWLEQADITLDGLCVERLSTDLTDRRLQRYFNNGSFEQGGRLFGGFWQPMKKERRHVCIKINGERVTTLDFSQMAPRTLYGLAGIEPPSGDIYTLPGLEEYRDGVKKVFNAVLFADKRLTRLPAGTRKYFHRSIRIKDIIAGLESVHAPIKHLFFTTMGYKLQFIESEIIIDVLLELKKKGIVALPIHDAVVIPKSAVSIAKPIMLKAFKHHTGIDGEVDEEH